MATEHAFLLLKDLVLQITESEWLCVSTTAVHVCRRLSPSRLSGRLTLTAWACLWAHHWMTHRQAYPSSLAPCLAEQAKECSISSVHFTLWRRQTSLSPVQDFTFDSLPLEEPDLFHGRSKPAVTAAETLASAGTKTGAPSFELHLECSSSTSVDFRQEQRLCSLHLSPATGSHESVHDTHAARMS